MANRVLNQDGEWIDRSEAGTRSSSPSRRFPFRFALQVGAVAVLGMIAAACCLLLVFGEAAFRPAGSGPTVAVTANDLTEAYGSDSRRADSRFKNRFVEVSGEVIGREHLLGGHDVRIMMVNEAANVIIVFIVPEDNREQFDRIFPDAYIVIKGICTGAHSGSKMVQVEVMDSELVRVVRWTRTE
jgi:hypothetical protein